MEAVLRPCSMAETRTKPKGEKGIGVEEALTNKKQVNESDVGANQ